jgi:CTP synthase
MQIMVIEFARHVLGYADANSREFDEQSMHTVIDFMPGQNNEIDKGGTMRLGAYPCVIKDGTLLKHCYGSDEIQERHRHRYEFNNEYREVCEANGMVFGGTSPDGSLVESAEIESNLFHLGVQYHPEFKSRPNRAHPLFREFIRAAVKKKERN